MESRIKEIFPFIEDFCTAIYYGGSNVDPVIDNPHDYDYICFAKQRRAQSLLYSLTKQGFRPVWTRSTNNKEVLQKSNLIDLSQVRMYPYTQITWFSYLDPLMIKVIGEDVCPKTDIIYEHRLEFINCLKSQAEKLIAGKILNQKRWYHILRGIYILMNNSYDVSPEQRIEINILHDLSPGYEQIRDKTINLLQQFIL